MKKTYFLLFVILISLISFALIPGVASAASGLSVDRGDLILPMGLSVEITVTAAYGDGTTDDVTSQCYIDSKQKDNEFVSFDPVNKTITGMKTGSITLNIYEGEFPKPVKIKVKVIGQITDFTLSPNESSNYMSVGQSKTYKLTANTSNGQVDITKYCDWTSSDTDIATVQAGKVKAVAAGTATIDATFLGLPATTSGITCQIYPKVTSLQVSPALHLSTGETSKITVLATFDDGTTQDVTDKARYGSTNKNIFTVTVDPNNLSNVTVAAGNRNGAAVLTVAFCGKNASVPVRVGSATSLDIYNGNNKLTNNTPYNTLNGKTTNFKAKINGALDISADPSCLWLTSDPNVATVSQGKVSALKTGMAVITIIYKNQEKSFILSVGEAVSSIAITPTSPILLQGTTITLDGTDAQRAQFAVVASFTDSTNKDVTNESANISMRTSNSSVLSVTRPAKNWVITAVAKGTANLTLTYKDPFSGKKFTSIVPVTVLSDPAGGASIHLYINSNITNEIISQIKLPCPENSCNTISFVVRFQDSSLQAQSNWSTISNDSCTWSSSDATVATVSNTSPKGMLSIVGPGKTTIKANYGTSFSKEILLWVTSPISALDPNPATITMDHQTSAPVVVLAAYSDGFTEDVAAQMNWTSTNGNIINVVKDPTAGTVMVYGLAPGSASLTGKHPFFSGTYNISVTVNPVVKQWLVLPGSSGNPLALYFDNNGKPLGTKFKVKKAISDGTTVDIDPAAIDLLPDLALSVADKPFGDASTGNPIGAQSDGGTLYPNVAYLAKAADPNNDYRLGSATFILRMKDSSGNEIGRQIVYVDIYAQPTLYLRNSDEMTDITAGISISDLPLTSMKLYASYNDGAPVRVNPITNYTLSTDNKYLLNVTPDDAENTTVFNVSRISNSWPYGITANITIRYQGTVLIVPVKNLSASVVNVSSTSANGSYKAGDKVPITVVFSAPVNVTGTPQITLNSGPTAVVDYNKGSGTATLVFDYTVKNNENTLDLDYSAVDSLTLNGGTIKDFKGNDATLTLPDLVNGKGTLAINKNFAIDTTVPTVINVSTACSNGSYKVEDVVPVTVAFSESVNVTGAPQITLNSGPTAVVNYTKGSGTAILVFNYTVQNNENTLDLDYSAVDSLTLNGGTIKDAVGNDATLALATPGSQGSLSKNKSIKIDTTDPVAPVIISTDDCDSVYSDVDGRDFTVNWTPSASADVVKQKIYILPNGKVLDLTTHSAIALINDNTTQWWNGGESITKDSAGNTLAAGDYNVYVVAVDAAGNATHSAASTMTAV